LYVAGRRIKVVPRYALGFHLDAPPGFGSFASRIRRVENCLRQDWPAAIEKLAAQMPEAGSKIFRCTFAAGCAKIANDWSI
jgi:hypothetical protein